MPSSDSPQSPAPSSHQVRDAAKSLTARGHIAQAVDLLSDALKSLPDDIPLLSSLGNVLVNAQRPADALPYFQHALRIASGEPGLHNNLALALTDLGQFEEARAAFLAALALDPMFVAAHNNLANLYIMQGRHEDALTCLDIALQLDPHHASAKRNRAVALLSLGDFEQGWGDYEHATAFYPGDVPAYPLPPAWNGEPLAGRRLLLLTTRHGLGDTVQFIRYATRFKALGAHVILQCAMPLAEVLRNAPGVDEIAVQNAPPPPADFSLHIISAVRIFKTTLAAIPASVPTLAADPERISRWQPRIAAMRKPKHLLVGIAWQGNPHHQWDQFRSVELARFAPLAALPNVHLLSLQRGPGTEQIPAFQRLTHNALLVPTDGQQTYPGHLADSAAIITQLDLLITVDTFTAHLAGALAKPVWMALSTVADWRWLTGRADTPWYPTMTLFRQKSFNDWPELFDRLCAGVSTLGVSTLGVPPSGGTPN